MCWASELLWRNQSWTTLIIFPFFNFYSYIFIHQVFVCKCTAALHFCFVSLLIISFHLFYLLNFLCLFRISLSFLSFFSLSRKFFFLRRYLKLGLYYYSPLPPSLRTNCYNVNSTATIDSIFLNTFFNKNFPTIIITLSLLHIQLALMPPVWWCHQFVVVSRGGLLRVFLFYFKNSTEAVAVVAAIKDM